MEIKGIVFESGDLIQVEHSFTHGKITGSKRSSGKIWCFAKHKDDDVLWLDFNNGYCEIIFVDKILRIAKFDLGI